MKTVKTRDWNMIYWFVVFVLLFIPLTHSFFIDLKKLIKSVITYGEYKSLFNNLALENKQLSGKVKYYKTHSGIKNLIKERLNKVEDGELIIKFTDKGKNNS
ncbi:MAG: hypothetical protein HY094_00875 [Candidatus Melainabacteria bacterium]|nr:hypothetical protein [Candidatus Melainabacteria bacterium]